MNILLLNLAAADMMVDVLFLTPQFILTHFFKHPDGMNGTIMCKMLTGSNIAWVGGGASVFTLVVIALDRYYAVFHPNGSKRKLTNKRLKVCEKVKNTRGKINARDVGYLYQQQRNQEVSGFEPIP